jgi:hypothetical protein
MRLIKIALAIATLAPLASYAALGAAPAANASSAAQPRVAQSLTTATTSASASASAPYTVHETRGSDGVTVREYATANNVVFAVTWKGPVRPDMSVLLGSYFHNYLSAGESQGRGTGPLIERNGDVQIESEGGPGHLFGRAYLPRLVPVSVNAGALQ